MAPYGSGDPDAPDPSSGEQTGAGAGKVHTVGTLGEALAAVSLTKANLRAV